MGILNWLIEKKYVSDCLKQKYKELPETRSYDDPVFKKVLDPLNSGDNAGACSAAQSLIKQFPDFAGLYGWWGLALLRMESLSEAREILNEGLNKANKKYSLCACLGEVEWKARDLKRAVYWWVQALHCQESLKESRFGGIVDAYLYLYYVALAFDLRECADALLRRVDTIAPLRLDNDMANDLFSLARNEKDLYIEEVLKKIVKKYLIEDV